MKQFIAIILILGLILILNFNLFLLKPKQAKALDGGGSWMQAIKEIVLDAIGWTVSDLMLKRLEAKIIAWGQGRTADANEPLAVSDWVKYFKDAVALGAAKYIIEFRRTEIEPEIKKVLEDLGFGTYAGDLMEYHQYAKSTLEKDLGTERYQIFKDSDYSLLAGGWNAWFGLMKPQNNVFGQILMAEQARRTAEQTQKEAADKEVIGGSIGYRNETVTTKTDLEACRENCAAAGPPDPACLDKCEMKATGIPIASRIKNWGSTIEKSMTNALGKDMARIISADEISELIGVFFSALMNKAINTGLGAFQSLTTKSQVQRAELKQTYSYQRTFKKEQTLEEIKDFRSQLLANILKSIQQLSRSIISCEEKEMMTIDNYSKNVADIFAANVEALYVGLEGVNLKPDFEVLDPSYAPYSVYGHGWGQVPAIQFPSKCQKIIEQAGLDPYTSTCQNIKSGLEPNYDSRCKQCMYDYDALNCPPGPTPPLSRGTEIPETTIKAKQDFYNACRGWYLVALDHCDDCLKKVDGKCGQLTDAEKTACIEANCSNYDYFANYVVSPPFSGLDFHNKCLIEEQKEACYVCLKEYFVPSGFCSEIEDYMARSIVKYPALVKMEKSALPWWISTLGGVWGWITNAIIGDDKGMFLGPADEGIMKMGGECDDNWKKQKISTALICRIMPEFEYKGEKVCRTKCQVSEKQLRDITDFSPGHKDCGETQLDIGGHEPQDAIKAGVMRMRGKCCATLWQYDSKNYAICVGLGKTTTSEEEEPETVCLLGEGEMTHAFTTTNVVLSPRHNAGLISTGISSENNCVILKSTERPKEVTMYVAEPYCDAYRDSDILGNIVEWWDIDDDGAFSNKFLEVAFWAYCCNDQACTTFKKQPPSDKILCTFDVDGVVGTPNGPTGIDENGQPYKVCCGLSGYETSTYPQSYCSSTPIPADVCNDNLRFRTGGLYLVAVPDQATSLGGAEWCACEEPAKGCGNTCSGAGCSP